LHTPKVTTDRSAGPQQPGRVDLAAPAPGGRQRPRARWRVGIVECLQVVEDVAFRRLHVVDVHSPHATAGHNQAVGLTNEELILRYRAGERLDQLTAAAGMTRSGLYDRLRRLGVKPRTGMAGGIDDNT